MIRRRLVIVGAGPAGMSAAIAAAEAGLQPLVVDENPRIGGQIYRQPPVGLAANSAPPRRGAELLRRFHDFRDRIEVLTDTRAWGLFPERRLAVHSGSLHSGSHAQRGNQSWDMIEAGQLILAAGAYEYVPPFPGWTLPGVMTPGSAQLLAKTMQVLPGKRVLVAGTGPFLLVVAEQLHRAGMEVSGIVEAVQTGEAVGALLHLLPHPSLLGEGLGYLYRLRRAGIPIHRGQLVVEARGEREVREVIVAPCDQQWHPDASRSRTVAVDTLCVGYGFVPRTQLAQLAPCRMRFANELGGWIPERDENLQTTVPGVFVAGDCGGVAGALVAQDEGRLAGLAVARQLGALDARGFTRARKPILRRLAKLRRFRAALDRLSQVRPGLNSLATADTVVCRCEELTRAEIETGVGFGGTDLRTLKVMTRLAMGPCQGRMCWPAVARWLADRTGKSMAEIGPLSARPPITPLTIGDLTQSALEAPEEGAR